MNLAQTLAHIKQKNIRLVADGDELVIHAPPKAMDTETIALLKAHKHALLKVLLHQQNADESNNAPLTITPDKLTLINLSQQAIDDIVARIREGVANVQDIYPLAPLQEGILFHHLLDTQGDTYLLRSILAFKEREHLNQFINALQQTIHRHDILRSAVFWQDLPQPVQVVLRRASLPVTELQLQSGSDALSQLQIATNPHNVRLDLRQAPLLAAYIMNDAKNDEWLLALLSHHIVCDHITLDVIIAEIQLLLQGRDNELLPPVPYRNFIAQLRATPVTHYERYFRKQLADVNEPTAPFNLLNVKNASVIAEACLALPDSLTIKIKETARQQGVSAAVLFHIAWAQVLAQCCGRNDVVFGTVLTGRLQGVFGSNRPLGMFINTLPIRIKIGNVCARQVVMDTYQNLGELLIHEQASLSLAQRCSGVDASLPLFSTLLNYRHSHQLKTSSADSSWNGIRIISGGEERTNYPITLSIDDFGNSFNLTSQCVNDLNPERINGYMLSALEALTDALRLNANLPLDTVSIIPNSECKQLIEDWNDTKITYSDDGYIHQRFEAQVKRTPDAIALKFANQNLSYAELNAKANQLAHYLVSQGVKPDMLIGICLERSLEMVIGLLGILKAGGAYVPLEPQYPQERLAFMLNDVAPLFVLTQSKFMALNFGISKVLCLDSDWSKVENYPATDLSIRLHPDNLAYCIYTSGSTGKPKGVGISHRGILNRLQWMQAEYLLDSSDSVLQKTPYSFDVSVWEFFWPLITGARLVIAKPELHKDSLALVALIRGENITTVHFVPSMLQAFVETPDVENCSALKRVICSGEVLPVDLVLRFQKKMPSQLHNLYGPTEASVDVSYWKCLPPCQEMTIPIGKPIANICLYILDKHLNPVPMGSSGELHIAGACLGRGYLNRPELTAEKFIPNPFNAVGGRLYKTGDLVRHRPDGNIDYLGRIDHQIKIRGFRIELGEIEAQLLAHQNVKEAVVLAKENQIGDKQLVAYLVEQQAGMLQIDTLKTQLKQMLPDYMMPKSFVILDTMPITVNGKLDRKRLPEPNLAEFTKQYIAPRTDTEVILVKIWQEVLGVENIGIDDNFFELGGHSLLATQLGSRVSKQFAIELPLRSFFETTNVADLAKKIDVLLWTTQQMDFKYERSNVTDFEEMEF